MEVKDNYLIIIWKIENAKFINLQKTELYSSEIHTNEMDETKWKLVVSKMTASKMRLSIKREAEDRGPNKFGLRYQFTIETPVGRFSTPKRIYAHTFQKGKKSPIATIYMNNPDHQKTDTTLTPNNISIHCKIWKQHGSISQSCKLLAETQMKIEHCIFVGVVENFSDLTANERVTLKELSSSTGESLVEVEFFSRRNTMEIACMPKHNKSNFYNLKTFILDSSGNKTDIGKLEREFILNSPEIFPLPNVRREILIKNKDRYLRNDALYLYCEISFCSGIEHERVKWIEFETDFSNAVGALINKKGVLSDMKIQTATETFSVHTTILSAKSPVFEAMFKTNMKEIIQKCVYIDDVDAETVKRMLLFMYTDTFEELDWKDAMTLYFAADKYQILSLKEECTIRLKQSICLSNFCVLLLMADQFQDKYMKTAMWDFVEENGKEVLFSDQWRDLENDHPKVAIDILRKLFIEKSWIYDY